MFSSLPFLKFINRLPRPCVVYTVSRNVSRFLIYVKQTIVHKTSKFNFLSNNKNNILKQKLFININFHLFFLRSNGHTSYY